MSAQEPALVKKPRGFQPGHGGRGFNNSGSNGVPTNRFSVQARKQELMRLLLEGHSVPVASAALGISRMTGYSYLGDPEVRAELQRLNSVLFDQLDLDQQERFKSKVDQIDELGNLALERMKGILEDRSAHIGIVAKVAADVLDRCPETSKTKKLDITSKVLNFKAEDLMAAAQAAYEVEEFNQMKQAETAAETEDQQNLVRD